MATRDLWRLLGGTVRLRLTAQSLAGLPAPDAEPDPVSEALSGQAARLAGWLDEIAGLLARPVPLAAVRPGADGATTLCDRVTTDCDMPVTNGSSSA